jgi:hypothetical protein
MPLPVGVRIEKKADKPLTVAQKKRFVIKLKKLELQIKDLQTFAYKTSFRHI